MRNAPHFRSMIKERSTIGKMLVAQAIYVERGGILEIGDDDAINTIARGLDQDSYTADEALALMDAQPDWRAALESDPVPPWSIRMFCWELDPDRGQTELARRLGVSVRTVRYWISGQRECKGLSARAVRDEAKNI